ncbi:hypothetical protein MWU52_10270 [Jannaschia sp. S6380]|uniref:hypothetical protein n=1 Tax=Jannaschia sp. S6380 TaxID=2926408 RepID=UPI001FF5DAAC|nr:hypothetical protein [Jannaschia sp. S6380]MCK0167934.1 hypothetical protein [Jannaschia sp. S6380]
MDVTVMQGMETAIWWNGEWITRRDPDERAALVSHLPEADADPVPLFEDLRDVAIRHLRRTGRTLPVHEELAHLFAAITCGHPVRDRDGINPPLLVRTIAPDNRDGCVEIDLGLPFDHLLVVRITPDFAIAGRRVDRAALPRGTEEGVLQLAWSDLTTAEIAWHGYPVAP